MGKTVFRILGGIIIFPILLLIFILFVMSPEFVIKGTSIKKQWTEFWG